MNLSQSHLLKRNSSQGQMAISNIRATRHLMIVIDIGTHTSKELIEVLRTSGKLNQILSVLQVLGGL